MKHLLRDTPGFIPNFNIQRFSETKGIIQTFIGTGSMCIVVYSVNGDLIAADFN